jgi:hypothetical protein
VDYNKHMGKMLLMCFGLAGFVLCLWACGQGGKIEEYSAKQFFKDPGGREGTHNIFVSHGNMRMETRSPMGKGSMVVIFRKDKGVTWTLFPENKFYMENKLDQARLQKTLGKIPMDTTKEDLGTETVNGFKCRKMRVETATNIMGQEIKSTSTVWTSDRLDLPLRSQGKDGGIMELRDIKPGSQPPDLFEIPAGYTKREMPFFGVGEMQKRGKGRESMGGKTPDLPFKLPKDLKMPFGKAQ